MSAAPLEALTQLTAGGQAVWLVGGAVRDELLGRSTVDYDLAVEGDVAPLARQLARVADGHAFPLSEEFGAWRVKGRYADWQVDLTPLMGSSLDQDLRRRDLTINAIARELHSPVPIDPCGGIADLSRRLLRAVSQDSFSADPLRVVRLARFHAELGFASDPATTSLAAASAAALTATAGERIFQELRQLIAADGVIDGLALLQELGATAVVLPELEALRGVDQSAYHHLDVYDHTLQTLRELLGLEREPESVFGEANAPALRSLLAEPLANELTRAQALRFGALFHDIAKSRTRALTPEGRVTFFHHDSLGAEMVHEILGARLRASDRLSGHVAALARNHLRLGFLVHEQPLSKRTVYRYLSTCAPVEVDVTVLSVADRLATKGRNSELAVAKHLELAAELMPAALAYREHPPTPPIRGDRLARELGIVPGPRLGELLAELTEATYAGEVGSFEEAVAYARARIAPDVDTA